MTFPIAKIMEANMWIIRWILGALLIIIILGFALQNQEQTVSVQIINWQSPVLPLYFFLYIAFGAGLLTWLLVSTMNIMKLKGDILKLHREKKKVMEELNRLRNANIEEDIDSAEPEKDNETVVE
jgi:uncharacterized integral membrane protein